MSMEILFRIEAPELAASINNLAAAMSGNKANWGIPTTPAITAPIVPAATTKGKKAEEKKAETPATPPVTGTTPNTAGTEEQPLVEEAKVYTLVEVREKLANLSRDGKQAEVKALITGAGADKLSQIPPEKYAEVMAAAEKLTASEG